jgi:hypothetical protein
MRSDKERYEAYRNRAEELRAVAETMHMREPREMLRLMSVDYDKMADRLQPKLAKPAAD